MSVLDIVMVCKNNPVDVNRTLRSIEAIDSIDYRIIVIDSSDNAEVKDLFSGEESRFKFSYNWQVPQGVYAAMNTALHHVTDTNLVWFLNPGDTLVSTENLIHLVDLIKQEDSVFGYARAKYDSPNGGVFPLSVASARDLLLGRSGISHQSMLVKSQILKDLGGFSNSFKIVSDLEMQYKLLKQYHGSYLPEVLVELDVNGISHRLLVKNYWESHLVRIRSGEFNIFYATFITLSLISKRIRKSIWRH